MRWSPAAHLWFVLLGVACSSRLTVEPQPPPPARAAVRLEPRHPGPLGTGDLLFVHDGSYRYGWVALCQARADTSGDGWIAAGDEFRPYLVTSAGPGHPIDAFWGRDPSGRFAAFARDRRLLVFDAATRDVIDVGPAPRLNRPIVAFDHHGRLAYARDTGYQRDIVLVDLMTRKTHSLRGTRGLVASLAFSGAEHSLYLDEKLFVDEVVADTNGDGRLELPWVHSGRSFTCDVPSRAFVCGTPRAGRGDRPERVALDVGGFRNSNPVESVEMESRPRECSPGDIAALAASAAGATLVALGGYTEKDCTLSRGPLEWRPSAVVANTQVRVRPSAPNRSGSSAR